MARHSLMSSFIRKSLNLSIRLKQNQVQWLLALNCVNGRLSVKRSAVPGGSVGKESACQCRRPGFKPWVRKIPWRRKWQPTPVFLPEKFYEQRNLVGYSPQSCKRVGHDLVTKLPRHHPPCVWHALNLLLDTWGKNPALKSFLRWKPMSV